MELRQSTSPLLSNVPLIRVSIATAPSVALNAVFDDEMETALASESSTLRSELSAVSETDSRSTSETIHNTQSIAAYDHPLRAPDDIAEWDELRT